MSTIIAEPVQRHVPAWKKLGLKLKYANQEPSKTCDSENHTFDGIVNRKKRKPYPVEEFMNGSAESIPHPKKSKNQSSKSDWSTVSGVYDTATAAESWEKQSSPLATVTSAPKRKSVSFTPETKAEDGDSVKQIYKTWLASEQASDPSFDPSTLSPSLRSITVVPAASSALSSETLLPPAHRTQIPQKSKRKDNVTPAHATSPTTPSIIPEASSSPVQATLITKKAKKKGRKKDNPNSKHDPQLQSSAPVSTTLNTHSALTYLETYHKSPQTWKFSKPQQNHLLRHLFGLPPSPNIPPSYDHGLLSYMKGLKGTSARARIRDEALKIREEDQVWLESEMENETLEQNRARRKRDYENSVQKIKEGLKRREREREEKEWEELGGAEEWEERLRKRRRAEVVLWGVGEYEVQKELRPQSREGRPQPIQEREMPRKTAAIPAQISGGKKIVFTDDGVPQQTVGTNIPRSISGFNYNTTIAITPTEARKITDPTIRSDGKKLSKRKRRANAVPDDESSSSSSSSSESSDEEKEEETKNVIAKREGNSRDETSTEESDDSEDEDGEDDGKEGNGSRSENGNEKDLNEDIAYTARKPEKG